MRKIREMIYILLLALSICALQGCSVEISNSKNEKIETTEAVVEIEQSIDLEEEKEELSTADIEVYKDEKFGGVFIDINIEDFDALGFAYGDSVDIVFSNGYELRDIPYYNGFYAKTGDPMLVGYHGYGDIEACISNGDSLWEVSKVKKGDKVKISRREKGKYKSTQELLNLQYTDNREDYKSDEVFANFRNVKVGNIKEGILYRGASPINNEHKRAKYANDLMEKVGIKYDVDLSDDENEIKKHFANDDFESEYFKKLYDTKDVSMLSLDMNYKSRKFAEKIVKAAVDISKNEGPYYIHCVEGKDRTGFLCMVIEGLAGANYDEIIADYMITYDNYYGINKNIDKEKYEAVKTTYIDSMLRFIADSDPYTGNGTIALEDLDWVNVMGRYLSKNGMSDEDINNLYNRLGIE